MWALLCWIGVVLFAMLGTGGLLVGVSTFSVEAALVGAGGLLAAWLCWRLARRLSTGQMASARTPAQRDQDDDDDDDSGGFASALLAERMRTVAIGSSPTALATQSEAAYEPLECKADPADSTNVDRSDDCASGEASSDNAADSGADNSSSD